MDLIVKMRVEGTDISKAVSQMRAQFAASQVHLPTSWTAAAIARQQTGGGGMGGGASPGAGLTPSSGSSSRGSFLGLGGGLGTVAKLLGITWGASQLRQFAGEIINTDIAYQRITSTLKVVSGDAKKAAEDFAWLRKESDRIGISFLGNADNFARFAVAARTAGFSAEDTRRVFTAVTSAGVTMGLRTESISGAFLALEQMLSKGKVSIEELRRQGNSLPGAMQIMARAYNITVGELFKRVESGAMDSAEAVRLFAQQLMAETNLTPEINRSIRDIERLSNAWGAFKAELGKNTKPLVSGIVGGITEDLSILDDFIKKENESVKMLGPELEVANKWLNPLPPLKRFVWDPIFQPWVDLAKWGYKALYQITPDEEPATAAPAAASPAAHGNLKPAPPPWMTPKAQALFDKYEELVKKNRLDALSDEEKLTQLKREQAEISAQIELKRSKMSSEDLANAMLDREKLTGEIQSLERRKEKITTGKSETQTAFQADSLAQAGLFAGSSALLNPNSTVDQEQLVVLRKIEANTSGGKLFE